MSIWIRNKDFMITKGTLKQSASIADIGGRTEGHFWGDCGVRIFTKPLGLHTE